MFKGIVPPIITPFHEDYTINEAGYAEIIEYMIAGKVHAVIVGGTTGESYALSAEERVRQFYLAKSAINGRIPMICGVNDMTTKGACGFAKAAREAGADGLLVAAPPYSLPTDRELVAHCLAIDRAAGLPIMLYNYPGRTGVTMGADFLDHIGQHDNFRCIKESSGDVNRIHLLAHKFSHLDLFCGAEDQALEFFAWGATGWVTPMGNFFIEEVVDFHRTCIYDKDLDKARRMMKAFLPLTSVLEDGGQLVQSVKHACELRALPAGPVRPPLCAMEEKSKHELREVVENTQADLNAVIHIDSKQPVAQNKTADTM